MSTPTNPNESSQIAQGTVVKGTIKTTQDIRIDGVVDGDLDTKGKLIVGETGVITGKLKTDTAIISGDLKIESIEANNLVFQQKAKFKGSAIYHNDLTVDSGAKIEGSINKK